MGNKLDLAEVSQQLRQVPQMKGKEFADNLDIPFLETSAKVRAGRGPMACRAALSWPLRAQTGTFVDTAFLKMAFEIKQKMTTIPGDTGSKSTSLNSKNESKSGCC